MILKRTEDSVWGVVYLKILTFRGVEIVKTKNRGVLDLPPYQFYEAEMVKTKKNWIVKNILKSYNWCRPDSFEDYLKVAQVIECLNSSLRDGEITEIAIFLQNYFSQVEVSSIKLSCFELDLKTALGYKNG